MLTIVKKNLREKRQEPESMNAVDCPTVNKQNAGCKEALDLF